MNQLNHQEKQALYRLWKEEEAATFTGWDFSHLNGRCQDGELPWDYESMAHPLLCPEKELLDRNAQKQIFPHYVRCITMHSPRGDIKLIQLDAARR